MLRDGWWGRGWLRGFPWGIFRLFEAGKITAEKDNDQQFTVTWQMTALLCITAADQQDMVAVDFSTRACGEHGAVRVAIEGNGNIGIVRDHGLLNVLCMQGATIQIYVPPVRNAVKLNHFRAERS